MILRRDEIDSKICRMAVVIAVMVGSWTVPAAVAWSAQDCFSATGKAAVAVCRTELLSDPGNVDIRFALSDAFMALKRYADAVSVLREGFEHFPGDDRIKKRLILAESYLEEQQWIESRQKRSDAAAGAKKVETKVRLSIIRCKKLKGDVAINACNQGLAVAPGNPELLTGRGNAWLEMGHVGNAILDFESALAVDPKNRSASKNLRLAHTKRKVKAAQCLQGDGPESLAACDAALMPGASDAFDIQKKRALLLDGMGRGKEAADAYRAAARLNPSDSQIRRALAALSPGDETPSVPPANPSSAASNSPTEPAIVKRPPPPVKKPPVKPTVAAPPPLKVASVKPKPPVKAPVAKAPAAIEAPRPKPKPAPIKTPMPVKMAAVQPRQYSNAPEVPGITH